MVVLYARDCSCDRLDEVVDDDGVGGSEEALQSVRYLGELHPRNLKDLLEVLVVVDVLSLLWILQTISLRRREMW